MVLTFRESDVRNLVGHSFFQRGKAYARRGRVKSIEMGDDEVKGLVQGTTRKPYEVKLRFDHHELLDSECSCPMGGDCKHVAALAVAAIQDQAAARRGPVIDVELLPSSASHDAFAQKKAVATKPRAQKSWQKAFSGLLPGTNSGTRQPQYSAELLFRFGARRTHDYGFEYEYEWEEEDKEKKEQPVLEVAIRLRHAKAGSTNSVALRWKDFRHRYENIYTARRESLIPLDQYRALERIASSCGIEGSNRASDDWYQLFNEGYAKALWPPLLGAHESGIQCFWFDGNGTERLIEIVKEPAIPLMKIADHPQGFTVTRELRVGDKILEGMTVFFGEPFAWCVTFEPSAQHAAVPHVWFHAVHGNRYAQNVLAPLTSPLVIPRNDLEAFQSGYLPEIVKKRIAVESASLLVRVPVLGTPHGLVHIAKEGIAGIMAALGIRYEGVPAIAFSHSGAVVTGEEGIAVVRDEDRESLLRQRLASVIADLPQFWSKGPPPRELQESAIFERMAAARFLRDTVPLLAAHDFEIAKDGDVPVFAECTDAPIAEFSVEARNGGTDWFDLHVDISVGGEKIPFHEAFAALAKGEEALFLAGGRFIPLTTPFFQNLKRLIERSAKLPERAGEGIAISRFQAGWWEELKKLGVVAAQAKAWQSSVKKLLNAKGVDSVQPPGVLQGTLRPYQREGFSWLAFLRKQNLGGVLADDMGLGKTIQAIAAIAHLRGRRGTGKKPFLVLAPTSVVETWDMELERFAPALRRVILRKGDREELLSGLSTADVVVTSYSLLHRDWERIKDVEWDTVILDEAQMLKNYQAKAYALVRELKAGCRIALTGTPMENNLMELWAIFSIVAPGLLPPPERFREAYQRPIEKEGDAAALAHLRAHIRPFLMRRKKELVEKDLPAKTEQTILLEMHEKQRAIYDLFLQRERQRVLGLLETGGLKAHRFEILRAITRMRQLCLHPGLVDPKYARVPSAKLDALIEHTEPVVSGGKKALVFSQFTSFLSRASARLDQSNVPHLYLDGSTGNRKSLIERFQTDAAVPLFLISLKAGGFGITLTAAEYCFLLDPWWNPAVETQAIDRTHRIGQTKRVVAYRFIMKNSIEEKVVKLQERKRALFANVLDKGDAFSSRVTEDDIRAIFD